MTFDDLTPQERDALKGEPGEQGADFKYEDFTQNQINALKGEPGANGESSPYIIKKTGNVYYIELP